MGKVEITKEQKEALKEFKDTFEPAYWLDVFLANRHNWEKVSVRPLMDFTLEEFALILAGRYEVEQPFQVGDWLTFDDKDTGRVVKVDEFDKMICTDIKNENGVKQMFPFDFVDLRHATPDEIAQEKERRRWAELGRGIGEFRKGDIAWDEGMEEIVVIQDPHAYAGGDLLAGNHEGNRRIRPVELELVCPVELRFDMGETV